MDGRTADTELCVCLCVCMCGGGASVSNRLKQNVMYGVFMICVMADYFTANLLVNYLLFCIMAPVLC
jgi:hypothetical protein